MVNFIAYYRVSTEKQGASGLGLDAQRAAVAQYINNPAMLKAEYTEIESGKSHMNRPQLLAALDHCKKLKATLVIARLDRLARNVAFISNLMEAGVNFIACDMPTATKFTIHIYAAVAEQERDIISKRTIAALEQAKKRGITLGNPRIHEARAKAMRNIKRTPEHVIKLIRQWRDEGNTLAAIAIRLNDLKILSPRGSKWYSSSVNNQILRQ